MFNGMRKVSVYAPYDMRVHDAPIPEVKDHEVRVRVRKSSICGTDAKVYTGTYNFGYPRTPGHDSSGILDEVGEKVEQFSKGDRVVIDPIQHCGKCSYCKTGRYNLCTEMRYMGMGAEGCLQEYVVVPEDRVLKLP